MRPLLITVCLLTISPAAVSEELLIANANGYTFSGSDLVRFDWLLLADGLVADMGLGEPPESALVVDMEARTVLPGLIDAHGHVMGLGLFRRQIDLVGAGSLDETLERVATQQGEGDGWVLGRGWNQELWPERRFPTAADLDGVISDRPAVLSRIDGHASWANSRAMALAGVNRDTPDPVGGRIMRDENGDPTGIFVDAAENLILANIPDPDTETISSALAVAMDELNSLGITGVHDAGVDARTVAIYKAMADDAGLSVRIYAMISGAGENLETVGAPLLAYGQDRLTVRSVKLYIDGALGSRGAAMLEDYQDDPGNQGLAFLGADELTAQVAKANEMGFQVNVHAIGDRGNRMVLDAFERAGIEGGSARPRIEHAQVVAPDDIPRFVSLDVIASMQLIHATSDMNMAEDRVGRKRINGAYAWRTFVDQGTLVAAGSDFPVENANPFYGLHAAVSREDRNGKPAGGWFPSQSLTREEALRAFTVDAAYAAFQEDRLGSLTPGKYADFIVVDRDYFEVDADQIWQIQVEETWVGGERVFDSRVD